MGIDKKSGGQGFGAFTAGTGFTTLAQSGTNGGQATNMVTIQPEYRVVNALGGYAASGAITNSAAWAVAIGTYKIRTPIVSSISRVDSSPVANGATVHFTVTFSESVFGVNATDFSLVESGVSGSLITSVSPSATTLAATFTVTVQVGTGTGTVGLNLVDNDSITNLNTIPLGGTGAGNGNFAGETYSTPNCTTPSVSGQPASATRTAGQSVTFSVTASGSAPLTYQWRKGGVPIPGATSSSYTIASVVVGDAASYDVVVTNACGSATSNAATLTVNKADTSVGSITASTSTYGGTTNLSATVTPAVAGSVAFLVNNGSTPVAASYNAATGAATASGVAHGLAASATPYSVQAVFTSSDANYNGSQATNATALTVNKANQTITVGTPAPAGATYNTSFNLAASADSTLSVASIAAGGSNTATVNMDNGSGTCVVHYDQAGDGNYNAATEVASNTTAAKASQTITFGALADQTYGAVPFSVSASASSGLAVTFASTTTAACTTSGTNGATVTIGAAGPCSIKASQAGNGNYNAATDVTQGFSVNARAITVTADGKNKTYGDSDPSLTYQITSGSLVGTDSFSGALTRVAGENVGTHAIQQGTLGLSSNYVLTYVGANLAITPKTASVTPNPGTKSYGDVDPALTGILSGFLAGDLVTATYSRAAGETVGPYAIGATLSPATVLGNYAITYNTASFIITAKTASVTPDPATKIFGAADPALTGTLSGFLASDGVTATYSRTAGETVGGSPYTISAVLSPAPVLGNYTITYNTANFTITPGKITVTADAQVKTYGDADPPLTYQVTAGTLVPGTYGAEVGTDVPTAQWRFEEGAGLSLADSSSHGHTATFGSATAVSYGVRGALADTTTGLGLAVGHEAAAMTGISLFAGAPGSIEFWLKPDAAMAPDGYGAIIANDSTSGVFVRTSDMRLVYQDGADGNGDHANTTALIAGHLYHVVLAVDGAAGTGTWYVNGTADGTFAFGGPVTGFAANQLFGQGIIRPLEASLIDELALYSAALSAERVMAHYAAGPTRAFTGGLMRAAGETVGSYPISQS
ncbi:MAG: hypothetical protein DMF90_11105, partial [Acidobacteria bacterium]